MHESVLISLAGIVVLGVLAQYIAWRFRLPAILLLLVFGIMAGPVTGLIDSDELFGRLLFPFVSISVAVILFEGGLSLRIAELRGTGSVVWFLVSIGALVTWAVAGIAAYLLLGLSKDLAVLLGAILVVTGPTVIIPLLRHVRPIGQIASIVKWEGIVIDPIGAMLAVLVYGAISGGPDQQGISMVLINLFKTVSIGTLAGLIGAMLLIMALKRHMVPDFLHNPVSLIVVLSTYAVPNLIQDESGLFAVVVMGVILANQKSVSVERIVRFKEDLRVLLISILFIVLSARLKPGDLDYVGFGSLAFLAVLIFIGRPLAVAFSTIGSNLPWRHRLFLAWMAPRGIVAAAVSSIFALELMDMGQAQAAALMPLTFLVIIGTVTFYGLTASIAGRSLGVSQPNPQGFLIVGAHSYARKIAHALSNEKISVILTDTNWTDVNEARMEGLTTIYGSVFSQQLLEYVETSEIGRLLALTYNDEVNSLAAVRFSRIFERRGVYQLLPESRSDTQQSSTAPALHGRILFSENVDYLYLLRRFRAGAVVKRTNLTDEFDYDAFKKHYGPNSIPLFLIDENGRSEVFTTETTVPPKAGDILISLVDPPDEPGSKDGSSDKAQSK